MTIVVKRIEPRKIVDRYSRYSFLKVFLIECQENIALLDSRDSTIKAIDMPNIVASTVIMTLKRLMLSFLVKCKKL